MASKATVAHLVCEFSPSGDLLAVVTADGRLKTFDTGNGQLRCNTKVKAADAGHNGAPAGHLVDKITCICWVATGKKKSKGWAVAAGNAAGLVRLVNIQTGEITWTEAGAHDGGVSSITSIVTQEGALVLSSGQDGQLCTLDAQTGAFKGRAQPSKHPCSCLKAAPGGDRLVWAGSAVVIWDPVQQERVASFSGHPTQTRAACFSPDGKFALTASDSERQVAIWKLSSSSLADPSEPRKKKKSKSACGTLTLQEPALTLDACRGRHEHEFIVGATSDAGHAYVWRVDTAAGEGDEVAAELLAKFAIAHLAGVSGDAEHVLGVKLEGCSGSSVSVLLARGTWTKPTFQRVSVECSPLPGKAASRLVQLPSSIDGGLLLEGKGGDKKTAVSKAAMDVTVLGADNAGGVVARATVGKELGQKRSLQDAGVDGDTAGLMNGVSHAEDMETDADDDGDEDDAAGKTLEERVAALEAQTRGSGQQDNAVASSSGAEDKLMLQGPSASDKADSLVVLLTQAVRSGDKSLLERCLAIRDERVVKNSVTRLVATDAALLLTACVERLQSKAVRGAQLAVWIRALLLRHTAFFMSAPSVQPTLTTLYQIIEQRLSMHRALVSLAGRLDLVLAQLPPSSKSKQTADGDDVGQHRAGPLVTYESDEEGVAVEEVGALQAGKGSLIDDSDDDEDEQEGSEWEEVSGDGENDDEDEDLEDMRNQDFADDDFEI